MEKRKIWNKGIKLFWNKLWVRKNEFHSSLDIDGDAIVDMDHKEFDEYMNDLVRRRNIAHERDINK